MIKKVFIAFLLFSSGLVSLQANPIALLASPEDRWVDSVYSNLNEDQRIRQLLFKVSNQWLEIDRDLGGIIFHGHKQTPDTSPNDGLIPLFGMVADLSVFSSRLGVDAEIIAATNDNDLVYEYAKLCGLELSSSKYQFVYGSIGDSAFHDNEDINENLTNAFYKGISKHGLALWHPSESINKPKSLKGWDLRSLLKERTDFRQLKKSEIRKLTKKKRPNEIIYYQTDYEDLDFETAAIISDVVVFEDDPGFYLSTLSELVRNKKIKRKLLEKRVKKVLRLKYWASKSNVTDKATPLLSKNVIQRKVWEKGIVLVNNQESLVPIRKLDDHSFASISLGPFENETFQSSLDHYSYFSHFDEADYLHDEGGLKKILNHYDYVIAGFSFPEYADAQNEDALRRVEFLKELSKNTNVIIVVFAESKWLGHFGNSKTLLMAHNYEVNPQEIVPQIIFGSMEASGNLSRKTTLFDAGTGNSTEAIGRLGYSFPEFLGFDSLMEKKIDYIVTMAIDSAATPGCQVLVARNGKVVLEKAYGHFTYDSIQAVSTKTLYDLASVTKVTGTLQATMFLEGQRAFNLDDPVSKYLEELKGTNKEDIIIRKILTHQGGLQPYYPFYRKALTGDRLNPDYLSSQEEEDFSQSIAPGIYGNEALEDSVWSWTIQSKLRKMPEGRDEYDYKYSDHGFLTMHKLNERLINQPMEDFLSQNFYEPLGMTSTGYQPLCRFPLHSIAPTEVDYDFRNSLVWGMVHDENAALTGGVGGHAGLFSTANDLAILLQMNLQDGYYGGIQYIRSGTVPKFAKKQFPGNRRGLGWDKPSFFGSYRNTSSHSSKKTFGHLGFTGTAVWIDPKYDLIYIFLSNRVHPNRKNDKLMVDNIRSRIHEVIYESMPEIKRGS